MSYTLTIYPVEVMRAIQAGADWEELEDVPLEPAVKERLLRRLEAYGYQLAHQRDGVSEYEKDIGGLPVQVGVYDTEISFSAPYWDGLGAVLPDLRMDVAELADDPSLAVYDPQQEEWGSDEEHA